MSNDWRNELVTKGAAIDAQEAYMADHPLDGYEDELALIDILRNLPPAQPEDIARDIATIIENEKDMRVILKNAKPERTETHSCVYQRTETHEWIPVSEDTPKKRDWYLGIFKEPDTGWINPLPFICDYLLGKKTKVTTKEGWILRGFTDREEHIDYYFNLECVAWMPLPEPYKGNRND